MTTGTTTKRRTAAPEDVWATLDRIVKMNEEFKKKQREELRQQQEEHIKQREEEAKWRAEDAKRREEFDRELEATQRIVKANGIAIGGLHNSFGELAEHLVAPGIADRFVELGLQFAKMSPNAKINRDGKLVAEVDLWLENSATIIVVEIKAKVKSGDVREHGERLKKIREVNAANDDRRDIFGAVAGAVFGKAERNAARNAGFYVIVQSEDTMKMDIPEGFVPKVW